MGSGIEGEGGREVGISIEEERMRERGGGKWVQVYIDEERRRGRGREGSGYKY